MYSVTRIIKLNSYEKANNVTFLTLISAAYFHNLLYIFVSLKSVGKLDLTGKEDNKQVCAKDLQDTIRYMYSLQKVNAHCKKKSQQLLGPQGSCNLGPEHLYGFLCVH